jgi:hypothetical protein
MCDKTTNRSVLTMPVILVLLMALPLAASGQTNQACLSSGEGWIFCTGFEEGNLALWDDYDGNPPATNTLMEHPGPFNEPGNHVVRLRAPEGTGGADLVKVLPSTHDRLYARWYVMWEPGYDFNARGHGGGLFAGDRNMLGVGSGSQPDGYDRFSATLEPHRIHHQLNFYSYYPGMYQDCVDPNGSCWGDSFPCLDDDGQALCTKAQHRPGPLPPVLETGRWYCIEMMMDGGTPSTDGSVADGVLNLWIDDVEYGPWDDLWFRATPDLKITTLWINLWHHAEHSVEGIMVDEVVVSTERIGVGAVPTTQTSWGSLKSSYRDSSD